MSTFCFSRIIVQIYSNSACDMFINKSNVSVLTRVDMNYNDLIYQLRIKGYRLLCINMFERTILTPFLIRSDLYKNDTYRY